MRYLLALVLVLLTAACGTQLPAPAPANTAPATSTAESLSPRLRRALPTEEIMTRSGYKLSADYRGFVEAENLKKGLVRSCEPSPSDLRVDDASLIGWSPVDVEGGDLTGLEQTVTHYRDGRAAEAVADAREQVACGKFHYAGTTYRVTGELALPALAGVDAQYVVCGKADPAFLGIGCLLVVGKGDLAVVSLVRGLSNKAVPAEVRRIGPLLASTLAGA
ncbi:hypothetical protein M8C13_09590 [Crossiella sp. SN42]|uniref:hypothetical protein n=1 Tax=Crossiella sp. SN42 TaxID=2944808 RepID=UPI00207C9A4F|nr:hypothetical protein [Crossiella sp. SN42]MCO1576006.1 hypothetical protein [Crossiella sp. SN42]